MDWASYLFSFEGRINRAKYWLAGLVILGGMIALAGLVLTAGLAFRWPVSFGYNIDDVFGIVDPNSYRSLSWSQLPLTAVKAAGTALFVWVYCAASVKRLHDRDKSAWWMLPYFFLPGLCNQFADRLPDSYWCLLLTVPMALLYLYGFIEMGFLSGTRHPNRYGPNPLGKTQGPTLNDRDIRPRTTQGWDQQSELEIVPHKAGPPPVWRVKRGA